MRGVVGGHVLSFAIAEFNSQLVDGRQTIKRDAVDPHVSQVDTGFAAHHCGFV